MSAVQAHCASLEILPGRLVASGMQSAAELPGSGSPEAVWPCEAVPCWLFLNKVHSALLLLCCLSSIPKSPGVFRRIKKKIGHSLFGQLFCKIDKETSSFIPGGNN